jgi:solute carrier family 45 protein 1/2/4
MAVDRTLIVDTLPAAEQVAGNAWATHMAVVGGVVGLYMCVSFLFCPVPSALMMRDSGVVDLPATIPFLGSTQLEALSILAVILFGGVHLLTLGVVRERVLISDRYVFHPWSYQQHGY